MKKSIFAAILLCLPGLIFAGSCDDYPGEGMTFEEVPGGTKILVTAGASVSFDDVDSIRDARDEATMMAKAEISKFLNEEIQSDEAINRIVNESKVTDASGKSASREEMITRVKAMRNSSRALLRGVVVLGDCYTQGREVRVSVGLKPETIAAAGKLDSSIQESIKESANAGVDRHNGGQSPGSSSSATGSTGLQGMGGYSNSNRLSTF